MMLQGKAGLVTGAGRGIGRAVAEALARAGAGVVVNDPGLTLDGAATGERPADEVVRAITSSGSRALADYGSVASWDDAHAMVQRCRDGFGSIDFMVHCAGVLRDKFLHQMSEADWDAVIAVHLKGAFCLARACAGPMRSQGGGCLVFMTSTSGLVGALGQANYAAAKLGMVGFMRSAAQDLRRFGVRAHAIAPFAWTRMTQNIPASDDPVQKARLERLQRCRPEDVAPLVEWLVSDAAKDLTGQVFAARAGEVTLFELPLPKGQVARREPWTAGELGPALAETWRDAWVPLRVTADVFGDLDA